MPFPLMLGTMSSFGGSMTPSDRGKLAIREDVRLSIDFREAIDGLDRAELAGGEIERDENESVNGGGATTVLAASTPIS